VVVFGFLWFVGKVMNKFGHDISGKLLSRCRLLKLCQLIFHGLDMDGFLGSYYSSFSGDKIN
jgi:hypothetical protein